MLLCRFLFFFLFLIVIVSISCSSKMEEKTHSLPPSTVNVDSHPHSQTRRRRERTTFFFLSFQPIYTHANLSPSCGYLLSNPLLARLSGSPKLAIDDVKWWKFDHIKQWEVTGLAVITTRTMQIKRVQLKSWRVHATLDWCAQAYLPYHSSHR